MIRFWRRSTFQVIYNVSQEEVWVRLCWSNTLAMTRASSWNSLNLTTSFLTIPERFYRSDSSTKKMNTKWGQPPIFAHQQIDWYATSRVHHFLPDFLVGVFNVTGFIGYFLTSAGLATSVGFWRGEVTGFSCRDGVITRFCISVFGWTGFDSNFEVFLIGSLTLFVVFGVDLTLFWLDSFF